MDRFPQFVFILTLALAGPAAADIRIAQVYGGGGNAGAPFDRDFVELFNAGSEPVDVGGWSLQYASASGATWQVTALTGAVDAGGYRLVGQASGGSNGAPLPRVDVDGSIAMAAGAGKLALVRTTAALAGACPTSDLIVDLVGYGGANCFEGSGPVTGLGNALAAVRHEAGCTDSDDNAEDFAAAPPAPRDSLSPPNLCGEFPEATPSETPTPTASLEPAATSTPTATATASVTSMPSDTPTALPTATQTAEPTATPIPSATSAPTLTPTTTPTATASATVTFEPSPTATQTMTPPQAPTPAGGTPQPVCGNGVIEVGEHCDAGAAGGGEECPAGLEDGCRYTGPGRLAHGNPNVRRVRDRGCWLGWHLVHTGAPRMRRGLVAPWQSCTDQDENCDFDPEPGVCEFRVAVCLNVVSEELAACAPTAIGEVAVAAPRAGRRGDERRENRAALAAALQGLRSPADPAAGPVYGPPLGALETDLCSAPFPVRIALDRMPRRAANLIVRARGGDDGRTGLYARLRLSCQSGPPGDRP